MFLIELYKSLQGESSFTGLPCIFIRFAGCNLRCSWCDSEYTFTGGSKFSHDEVLAEVRRLSPTGGLVEITGGEPLLQEREAVPLMQSLLDLGYTVLLETSGERPLANVPEAVHKIVDVKCPDSGAADTFRPENFDALTARDEIKFVISSRRDYEFARDLTLQRDLANRVASVIFSPAFRKDAGLLSPGDTPTAQIEGLHPARSAERVVEGPLSTTITTQIEGCHPERSAERVVEGPLSTAMASHENRTGDTTGPALATRYSLLTTASPDPRTTANALLDPQLLAEWILADSLPVRLGLQIHKYIWNPATKGV